MLSDEDKSWIAENLLRGGLPADMVDALTAAGRSRSVVETEVEAARRHPYLVGASRWSDVLNRRLQKAYWVLDALRKLSSQADNMAGVTVEKGIGTQRFYSDFYFRNRPVVIRGAVAHWPALPLWTVEYLRQRWGQSLVDVQAGRAVSPDFETRAERYTRPMRLTDFIELVEAGPSNDVYMTARNSDANRTALAGLWDDIDDLPDYLAPANPRAGFFWFGPKGTLTPNHHDLTNNLMAQVQGRKRVLMADIRQLSKIYNHLHVFSGVDLARVDLARYPEMRDVEVLCVDIGPGDVLFLPVGWWHQVEALDVSITMTFTNFKFDNDYSSFYKSNGEM